MKKLLLPIAIICLLACAESKASVIAPQNTTIQSADSLAMVEYTGKYKFKDNGFLEAVKVSIENGGLISESEGYPKIKLTPDGATADTFKTDSYEAVVTFVRDDAKQIVGVKILVQGQELVGDKEKK
jgi:hypothetical protein